WKERLDSGRYSVLKAVHEGRLVGFVEFEFLDEETARINGMAIVPAFRRKGLSHSLMRLVFRFLKKNDFLRVVLLVKESNAVAKKLYRRHGFLFSRFHEKKIEGERVEEHEKELLELPEMEDYLN
ncbi:MAG: GNAT family N-acetyltransferase, partial [Candidatus Diapherotrites archaeon]|nr:GNAT family N-acetyltransferase [Candidatus Diapherotrites archaeon]